MKDPADIEPSEGTPPPFGGTWRRVYLFAFLSQVVFVTALFLIAEAWS